MRILALSAVLMFVLDQASKWLVVHVMNLRNIGAIDVLPPLLNFRMGWNTGINFGLFSGHPEIARYILVGLALIVSVVLVIWARRSLSRPVSQVAVGLVIGGALGNAVDRVVYGAVADFLNMSCCGITNPYTFNVADIGIFAGAISLVVFDEKPTGTSAGA